MGPCALPYTRSCYSTARQVTGDTTTCGMEKRDKVLKHDIGSHSKTCFRRVYRAQKSWLILCVLWLPLVTVAVLVTHLSQTVYPIVPTSEKEFSIVVCLDDLDIL